MIATIYKAMGAILLTAIVGVLVYFGYEMVSTRVALENAHAQLDITRERLDELSEDYESLRNTYNEAVRKTAVTELVVDEQSICVHITTADGQSQVIDTTLDPTRPVHVDYVVRDNRLWIRRVYDDMTPPKHGQTIDPEIVDIDWADPRFSHGVTIYRRLQPGRWVVTVTGDGSLGLTRRDDDSPTELSPPPPLREYPPIEESAKARTGKISKLEVLGRIIRGKEVK